jgi:hypothetical protein
VDSSEGRALLERAGVTGERLPVVVLFDGRVLVDPSNAGLAQALGIKTRPAAITYGVTVVGAGRPGSRPPRTAPPKAWSRPCWSTRPWAARPAPAP